MNKLLVYEDAQKCSVDYLQQGEFYVLSLEMTGFCNACCIYCMNGENRRDDVELSLAEAKYIIKESHALGIRRILIPGRGEPLADSKFSAVVQLATIMGMKTIVFTNGLLIDDLMAKFLFENDVTILIKIDSLNPKTHDKLVGVKGAFTRAYSGLSSLMTYYRPADDNDGQKIAVETVMTRLNIKDIPEILRFCKDNNLASHVDVLKPIGRARDGTLVPTPEQYERFKEQFQQIMGEPFGRHHGLTRLSFCVDYVGNVWNGDFMARRTFGNIREHELSKLYRIAQSHLHPV